jgi:hypothetical protein
MAVSRPLFLTLMFLMTIFHFKSLFSLRDTAKG